MMRNIFLAQEAVLKVDELKPVAPDDLKELIAKKGWSPELIAMRWGMTKRRVQQIIADTDRPRYYDDAINNLPLIVKK
ncbi:hypothetical protein STH12_04284 (plasmid) [Shewanella khirikhana]|uniref:Uncharacterized protein n=1 Tax=Shewanella khirikhana TaxID=1965282 RepID=A0ABN5U2H6_9GAMM|nr:hypothetical protein STH12_04284 [Shewanella khirikhana]